MKPAPDLDRQVSDGPEDDAGFDITAIDWGHYLQDIHLPSITSLPRTRSSRVRGERTAKPLVEGTDVVAVFDMEGTVLRANLVQQYLWLRDAERDLTAGPREVTKIVALLPRYLAAERRDRSEFIRSFLRLHKGMKVADIERYVAGSVGRKLRAHLLADALSRVAEHRAAGHTVLVTGGVDLLADVVASEFDEVVASGLHARDGVLTGHATAPPIVGEAGRRGCAATRRPTDSTCPGRTVMATARPTPRGCAWWAFGGGQPRPAAVQLRAQPGVGRRGMEADGLGPS